jgi:riboflavin transporter FmnP
MSKFWSFVSDNVIFVLVCILICAAFFFAAGLSERLIGRQNRHAVSKTRYIAVIGMCSAAAAALMFLEIPLFFAPSFYKLDFSEIPVLVCSFAMGPVAGVLCEFIKILLKLILKGTSTAFVGDMANFVIGSLFVLPASIFYYHRKTKKTALLGLLIGTLMMTVCGSAIVGMGTAVNSSINSVTTLVLFAVVPFNLVKGILVSAITLLIYKHIRPLLV